MGSGGYGVDDLPEIVYVKHFAALLQITPKALRQRAARGQVPRPFKLGKALAWRRDSVLAWLRVCGRSAGPADMKITLRPYAQDKSRWHVDIRIMNPCDNDRTIRKRMVAPAGLSKAEARLWGEQRVSRIFRELLQGEERGGQTTAEKEVARGRSADAPRLRLVKTTGNAMREAAREEERRGGLTLAEFFTERFMLEHLRLKKPGTQESYEQTFRLHIGPVLGALPMAAIDEDKLSSFRAKLGSKLGARTVNLVLKHLAKILRFAKKLKHIEALPEIEMLPVPRPRPKEIYSDEEISRLQKAAAELGTALEVICLLALDAGLRVSEICALEWRDIDFDARLITVQHNVFRGQVQTPKGTIGRVAMSSALTQALERHRKREPIGPLVLYRRNYKTSNEWRPHTRYSLTNQLHRAQRRAGLRESGPHLLRHTALTRLSNLGASVYVVQAVARHSHLQTTQAYIHTQGEGRTLEAARLLDEAAMAKVRGKRVAKRAKGGKK